ncbi:MAG TPA: thioredoxin family protein [Acidimicrobiales bacterium]|nr:thioredoxin family protein [Acidimicrobiales bacterium]
MILRLLVVAVLLGIVLALAWAHRAAGRRDRSRPSPTAVLPDDLRGGPTPTWVVFTTPYCATCGPVEDSLRAADPGARVVRVDATDRPDLAAQFDVRRAPTVVGADADGRVHVRLVGADAVRGHLAAT